MKEHDLQVACISWYKFVHKDKLLFSIPNSAKRSRINGYLMKMEGMTSGVPDLFLAKPRGIYGGLWIELKRTAKQKPTINQIKMLTALKEAGYLTCVISNIDTFIEIISEYLLLKPNSTIKNNNTL